MPSTLTIDDDLAHQLHNAAEMNGKSVSEFAAALLRRALSKPTPKTPAVQSFRVRPHHGVFAPGIDLKKLNRLADELDTDGFLTSHQRGV